MHIGGYLQDILPSITWYEISLWWLSSNNERVEHKHYKFQKCSKFTHYIKCKRKLTVLFEIATFSNLITDFNMLKTHQNYKIIPYDHSFSISLVGISPQKIAIKHHVRSFSSLGFLL